MDATDLAYAAGVVDSDGYIGVKRNTYAMRVIGDCTQPTYSERICVKQAEPEAVTALARWFGGSLTMGKPSAKRGRPLHTWNVTDKRAANCLRLIFPFLRIKREQAKNCLQLRIVKEQSKAARVAKGRGHMGSAHRRDDHSALMEKAYKLGKKLNLIGVR